MKVKYGDLSGWLKAAVIVTWVLVAFTVISFITGFIAGYSAVA